MSEVYCSSDAKLRVLGMERRTELRLGPNTPLAFSCLRLSVSPSGLVEVCDGWEGSYLHPKARWAKFDSPDYASLVAGRPVSEPKMMGLLSQFGELTSTLLSNKPPLPPFLISHLQRSSSSIPFHGTNTMHTSLTFQFRFRSIYNHLPPIPLTAFNFSHPSIISLPSSALHLPGPSPSKEQHQHHKVTDYQEAQEISSEALLPLEEEEEEGS